MKRFYNLFDLSTIYLEKRKKEITLSKRCFICDSTEFFDTFKSLGIHDPIRGWTQRDGRDICNRCEESIQNSLHDHYISGDEVHTLSNDDSTLEIKEIRGISVDLTNE